MTQEERTKLSNNEIEIMLRYWMQTMKQEKIYSPEESVSVNLYKLQE